MRALRRAVGLLPGSPDKRSRLSQLKRLGRVSDGSTTEVYLKATTDIFEDTPFAEYLPIPANISEQIEGIAGRARSPLQSLLDLDFKLQLPGDLLVKMDIALMAHSLEGRSPLLSREILDFVPRLPDALKIRGGTTKYLLRQLAKNYLSDTLIDQPKRGFEIPLLDWTNGLLRDNIFDRLTANAYVGSLVPYGLIEDLKHNASRYDPEKRAKMLWTLYVAEVWHARQFTPSPSTMPRAHP